MTNFKQNRPHATKSPCGNFREIMFDLYIIKLLFNSGRDILHELGTNLISINNITWQEISLSMKPPICMAKEFFVIKEKSQA